METLNSILDAIDGYVWGIPLIAIVLFVGLLLFVGSVPSAGLLLFAGSLFFVGSLLSAVYYFFTAVFLISYL